MASESIHEQIAAALRTLLAGITGSSYWYDLSDTTKNQVVRTTFFEDADLKEEYDHIILIRPGDETIRELSTGDASSGGGLRGEMEVFILVAHRFETASENPFEEATPTRWTIADRAVFDILRKLFLGPGVTLSGVAVNVAEQPILIDRARYLPKWAIAELRLLISYDSMATSP